MDLNTLYFGDNLHILRENFDNESADLIYLDPPFNSKRAYNLLFQTPKGQQSDAQITAFEDTWHWGEQAEREYNEITRQSNTDVSELIISLRRFLKESDMMAYLVMMTNRLLELHRVLKKTGSLYLHCDPTASHYLKVVMDAIFGAQYFRNEITWKRSEAHSDVKQGRKAYGNIVDNLLYFTKSDEYTFNPLYTPYDEDYVNTSYNNMDPDGRRWKSSDLTGPGGAAKGNPIYEFLGVTRSWRYSKENMERLLSEGRIHQSKPGAVPRMKHYLDEMPGVSLQNIWDDINPISAQANERLGYPTQKPLALLERIVQASSNPGDVVLDPFCGCGTAVHAAQKLGRSWIGIDITHLAIHLVEKRMKQAFPGLEFEIHGEPEDLESARDLAQRDKFEFQLWACSLVNAQPYKGGRKGADSGIDGILYFEDDNKATKKVIVSVKGGEHVTRTMLADLKNSVDREGAQMGFFITLAEPTGPMKNEAYSAGYYQSRVVGQLYDYPKIQILTIEELLAGKRPNYPDFSMGRATYKQARTEKKISEQPKLFDE